jgi:hypothetical protein
MKKVKRKRKLEKDNACTDRGAAAKQRENDIIYIYVMFLFFG